MASHCSGTRRVVTAVGGGIRGGRRPARGGGGRRTRPLGRGQPLARRHWPRPSIEHGGGIIGHAAGRGPGGNGGGGLGTDATMAADNRQDAITTTMVANTSGAQCDFRSTSGQGGPRPTRAGQDAPVLILFDRAAGPVEGPDVAGGTVDGLVVDSYTRGRSFPNASVAQRG
jgi:hypothetical protein